MTEGISIEEAIEALTHPVYRIGTVPDRDFIKALKLGIEAFKVIKGARSGNVIPTMHLLPGETKIKEE